MDFKDFRFRFLRQQAGFRPFTDLEIHKLNGVLGEHRLRTGDPLFREGDPGSECFIVVQGSLDVAIKNGRVSVARLPRGRILGHIALLDGGLRSATCRAAEPTALLSLSRDDLDLLLREGSPMAFKLLSLLTQMAAEQLRGATDKFVAVATREEHAAAPKAPDNPLLQQEFKEVATFVQACELDGLDLVNGFEVLHTEADLRRDYRRGS